MRIVKVIYIFATHLSHFSVIKYYYSKHNTKFFFIKTLNKENRKYPCSKTVFRDQCVYIDELEVKDDNSDMR